MLEKFVEAKVEALKQQIDLSVSQNANIWTKFDDVEKQLGELQARRQCNRKEEQIDEKFKKIASKYYYIEHSDKVNWYKAGYICRSMGGYLVNIENQKEYDELAKHLLPDHNYWIGIDDLAVEGEYRSTATDLSPDFLKWSSGNPNNYYNEDCVELWWVDSKHQINDYQCNDNRNFICERPSSCSTNPI